jgi:hypothetical protein
MTTLWEEKDLDLREMKSRSGFSRERLERNFLERGFFLSQNHPYD